MKIIFHHPLPIDPNAKSASGIRPKFMLEGFRSIGYEVDLVAGYSCERRSSIEQIKKNIKRGTRYEFVYSESSTMPMVLTDRHHLPLNPFLDWSFFHFCKKHRVPVGLFYRDIYWRFDSYGRDLNPLKRWAAKMAYWYDLVIYKSTLSRLFLPSAEMAYVVPWVNRSTMSPLPPGHDTNFLGACAERQSTDVLRLFYVGGISEHYQLHELFVAVSALQGVELTVCTRQDEWMRVRHEYRHKSPNIHIIHQTGDSMKDKLRSCDIAILFVKPQPYWEFASPLKLYEYLGEQKPILASHGTLAGKFVQQNGIGWSIPYRADAITSLLNWLMCSRQDFVAIGNRLSKLAPLHTWEMRARQVADDLLS